MMPLLPLWEPSLSNDGEEEEEGEETIEQFRMEEGEDVLQV